jgi:hypothetical protein
MQSNDTNDTAIRSAIRNIRLAVAGHDEWPTGRVRGLCHEEVYPDHPTTQVVDLRLAVAAAIHHFGGRENVPAKVWRAVAAIGNEIHAAEWCGDPDPMGRTAQGAFFKLSFVSGVWKSGHPLIEAIDNFGGDFVVTDSEDEGPNKVWLRDDSIIDIDEFIGRKVDGRLVIDVINHRWDEETNKFHHLLLLGGIA